MLGLGQTDGGLVCLPFAPLLEELDALESLEDGTLAADLGVVFEAVVLGHSFRLRRVWLRRVEGSRATEKSRRGGKLGAACGAGNAKKPFFGKNLARMGIEMLGICFFAH